MSGHTTTTIARGMNRLPPSREPARHGYSQGIICRFVAVGVHFCALNGTKA